MGSYMDAYCERTAPGLFAEPLNAITNTSFIIAAWAAWLLATRSGAIASGIRWLVLLSISVGLGSVVWHMEPNVWTLILDIIPILIFLVFFFWLYLRRIALVPVPFAVGSIAVFIGASAMAQLFGGVLHGALYYTPTLIFLLALAVYHARTQTTSRYLLLGASGVYALALFFRSIDLEVCPAFPIGTHFLWHSLNGLAAYLVMRCLILKTRSLVRVPS
jgi:hypothetical protein